MGSTATLYTLCSISGGILPVNPYKCETLVFAFFRTSLKWYWNVHFYGEGNSKKFGMIIVWKGGVFPLIEL